MMIITLIQDTIKKPDQDSKLNNIKSPFEQGLLNFIEAYAF